MAEQPAVNRQVVGSNPTGGAAGPHSSEWGPFLRSGHLRDVACNEVGEFDSEVVGEAAEFVDVEWFRVCYAAAEDLENQAELECCR